MQEPQDWEVSGNTEKRLPVGGGEEEKERLEMIPSDKQTAKGGLQALILTT